MFSDFPNLHPLVVHFPIVLILLSAVLQGVLVYREPVHLKYVTLIIMGAAFVGAVLASYVFHAHAGELPTKASAVFERHEQYAFYTVWLSGLTFLLQGISTFYKLQQRSFRVIVFISALVSAILLSITGHQGAQLVYVEGVGPQGQHLMKGHHDHTGGAGEHSNMNMDSTQDMEGMHHDHMDMNSGKSESNMEGMNHGNMEMGTGKGRSTMQGMDHGNMNMGSGKNQQNMQGMNHGNMNMGNGKNQPGMQVMSHGNMNMGSGKNQPSMKDMNHGNMNMGNGKNQPGMQGMNHGNMDMGTGKNPSEMEGMDHGTMGAAPNQPLIDPTPPYDNNPAWEEKRVKQKQ